MFAVYRDRFCFVLVNRTIDIGMKLFSSITPLSNNRVVVLGEDTKGTGMLKCYDIKTGTELDRVKFKCYAFEITEVKHADTFSLAVSFP